MAPLNEPPVAIPVHAAGDVARVRRAARVIAEAAGFDRAESESIVLSAIELATNLLRYAPGGVIHLGTQHDDRRSTALVIESTDQGPGIADLDQALEDGFSTGGGLGSGLPAVRRLMHEFEIESSASGTRTVATRWLHQG